MAGNVKAQQMKSLINIIASLLFSFSIVNAQNQNKIWYFGDHAGLNFNGGSPVPLTTGALNTQEGCSSIADNAGVLLFYTDGQKVYNKNHIVMPNGSGLLGNQSTTQSALIIPQPGSSTLYYIFAIDDLGTDMTYSIVDMSLAGGFGDVTSTKNVPFHSSVSEKQCAVQRCDGNIWLLSHQSTSNTFYADLITPAGISPSVLSSVGTSHFGGGGGGTFNSVGQMKFSQQGDRIALGIRDAAVFEVFNFNIATGQINNPISINPGSYPVAYGVEFSPDGSKLYGGCITNSVVYQFNLLAGSAAAISASATIIGSTPNFTNSLQLGTDGKIYVAKSYSQTSGYGFLDVINNPNALGSACNYVANGQSLGSKLSLLGLPGLVVHPPSLAPNVTVSGNTNICSGQTTTLTASGGSSYTWSGGTSASTSSISVSPALTTTYYVSGAGSCGSSTDTITVHVDIPVNITATSSNDSICSGQTVNLSASGSLTYQWSGAVSSTASSVSVNPLNSATYYVTGAANACGVDTDTLTVYVIAPPNVHISGASVICSGQNTSLVASGGTSYTWSGAVSSNTSSVTVSPAATSVFYVNGTNLCGVDSDSITVQVDQPININAFSSDDTICKGSSVLLTASGSASYQWTGGVISSSSSLSVSPLTSTSYYVSGSSNACPADTDTLTVFVENLPDVSISGSTETCIGQSVTLTAIGGSAYSWSGGIISTSSTVSVTPLSNTIYYATTSNACGTANDSVIVIVDTIPSIVLQATDTTICSGDTVRLNASGAIIYSWSSGSSLSSILVMPSSNTVYTVTGFNGQCSSSTISFAVTVNQAPVLSISGPALICENVSATYAAQIIGGISPFQYVWSDGDIISQTTITPNTVNTNLSLILTDANGCSDTSSINIAVVPDPVAVITPGFSGCSPLSVSFSAVSANAISYLWDLGNGTVSMSQDTSLIYITPGSYNISLVTTNLAGCADTLTVDSYVNVAESPSASITSTTNPDNESLITITNSEHGGNDCILFFGDGSSMTGCDWTEITHDYPDDGTYEIVQVSTNSEGCLDSAVINQNIEHEITFFAPNSFSPDGNGNNDIFYMKGTGMNDFNLFIYDRWGEKIFESHDIMHGWDGTYKGKIVEEDVYVWKVEYKTKKKGNQHKIGHVTVLNKEF